MKSHMYRLFSGGNGTCSFFTIVFITVHLDPLNVFASFTLNIAMEASW